MHWNNPVALGLWGEVTTSPISSSWQLLHKKEASRDEGKFGTMEATQPMTVGRAEGGILLGCWRWTRVLKRGNLEDRPRQGW